ncbi:hypothetical protein JST97_21715 [bacterium]|nr:hypothetical protein [bacterium]
MSPELQTALYRQLSYQARQATVELEPPPLKQGRFAYLGPRLKVWAGRAGFTLAMLSVLLACKLGLSLTALLSEMLNQQEILQTAVLGEDPGVIGPEAIAQGTKKRLAN